MVRGAAVFLQNTIVAQNTATDTGPDCLGVPVSLGNNLIGEMTDCSLSNPSATDLTGDPGLGDFTDNGTPGNGHFPVLAGSQVIDAANSDACPETDQLDSQRVGPCDIGSAEFGGQIVIAIDGRPRTDKDRINPNGSQIVNVAILSANGFDVALIDPNTIRFGATGTEAASIHVGRRDVNGDGQRDLVLRFQVQELGIECGATSVTLTGQLLNEQAITGSSPITTTRCKSNRKKASAVRHSHSFSS